MLVRASDGLYQLKKAIARTLVPSGGNSFASRGNVLAWIRGHSRGDCAKTISNGTDNCALGNGQVRHLEPFFSGLHWRSLGPFVVVA